MAATTFFLAPRVPVRAFLIAALASVVGAALLVVSLLNAWHVVLVALGAVVFLAGLILLVAALVAMKVSAAELSLDDDGYALSSQAGKQSGRWDEVTRITRTANGSQVNIHEGDAKRTLLQFNNVDPGRIAEILEEMGARLDAAKGYKVWDGS